MKVNDLRTLTFTLGCLALFARPISAEAPHKLALVIGMGGYDTRVGRLQGAVSDAESVGAALEKIGFHVTSVLDEPRNRWIDAMEAFYPSIVPGDVVLVYYAGHGVQVNGANYLLASNFSGSPTDLAQQGIAVDEIIQRVGARSPKLKIFIIDACRNNPFGGSVQGLAAMNKIAYGPGTYIAMAASPNQLATDRLLAKHLVTALSKRGIEVRQIFTEIRKGVEQESGGRQLPFSNDLLTESYILAPADLGMMMTKLTVSATFRPDGASPFQATVTVTPDAGRGFDAKLQSFMSAAGTMVNGTLVKGVETEDGMTFTFDTVQPGTSPVMASYVHVGGVPNTITAAALKLVLKASPSAAGESETGSVRGYFSLTASPMPLYSRSGQDTGPITLAGQIIGTYSKSLIADAADPPVAPIAAKPPLVPLPAPEFSMPKQKCQEACSAKIGDFKLVARYTHPYPQDPSFACDEKVFRLPDTWPGGPFLHAYYCKGRPTNGTFRSVVGVRLASSDREYDEDTIIVFNGGVGRGTIPNYLDGKAWMGPWTVKVFGTGTVESMAIEVTK